MPALTAVLHTRNDALRLGRALETLYPCDEIVVVDHGSRDGTLRVAMEYGARVVAAEQTAASAQFLAGVNSGWILCLDPRESLTEALAASLFEWKSEPVAAAAVFSVFLREETTEGWVENPSAQTRLVSAGWNRWHGHLPANDPSAVALEGELLHFVFP
ncbi:MAG TPA: glycosyltransferase [Candidatus Dormibacteraeota bacterium]|nr:glycosyltransferase [Candidatus Dormibacteraeota bacterium]